MGFQLPPFVAEAASEGSNEQGHGSDVGPGLHTARARVQEILTQFVDEAWGELEILEGLEDSAQLDKWVFMKVAQRTVEHARQIVIKRKQRLPPLRRRDR